MKRKDISQLILIAFLAAIISWFVAGLIFKSPTDRSADIPVVPTITTEFPDVKNDAAYNFFLNPKALDPALPVLIGGGNNNQPFSGQ